MAAVEWMRYRQVRTALAEVRLADLVGDAHGAKRWSEIGLVALADLRTPPGEGWLREFSLMDDVAAFVASAEAELLAHRRHAAAS